MKDILKIVSFYLVIGLLVFFIFGGFGALKGSSTEITYSKLIQYIESDNVKELEINQGNSVATAKLKTADTTQKTQTVKAIVPMEEFDKYLQEFTKTNTTSMVITYKAPSDGSWLTIISVVLPILMLLVLFYIMYSQQGGNNKAMSFGKSRARLYQDSGKKHVTFADVAGCKEEKGELEEVVDFLKYPKKYERLGAKIPKGILLVGPPGTGKTLLAKATAGEAGVPFFIITGSDFVEMFVGVGASRVRDLFENAQKNAPCLVFIDEIDAVGRQRGAGLGGGNDEREQTLNQLLVEMDGFNGNEGIIVLAATNRADVLDPALLRPGRFDRQIVVNAPDVKAREDILKVHSLNKPVDKAEVNFSTIAKQTVGFTGADLANVMNEAALLAARENKSIIGTKEIEESIKRVIAGPEKRSSVVSAEDKLITAYHEVGHAVVMKNLKHADKVHEISIIPRGMAAGYTISLPEKDDNHVSRNKLYDEITGLLGGRAAETVMLDDICTGAINDIQRATAIARKMVTEYGMSDTLGPLNLGGNGEDVFIGRDILRSKDVSEEVAAKIDEEVKKIIDRCFAKAVEVLEKDKAILQKITDVLLEKETLSEDEFAKLYEEGAAA